MKCPTVTSRWVLNHGICSLHCAASDWPSYGVILLQSFLKVHGSKYLSPVFMELVPNPRVKLLWEISAALEIFWGWYRYSSIIVVSFVANKPCYTGTHILFHPEQNTIIRAVICSCSWFLILDSWFLLTTRAWSLQFIFLIPMGGHTISPYYASPLPSAPKSTFSTMHLHWIVDLQKSRPDHFLAFCPYV